ncbi:MAG TPA: hypothetical protein VL574_12450 [Stellaceae bacterium]|nr:hypothetical protein [Stellaceae bacterium]
MFILKLIILFLVAMGIWHLLQRFGGNGAQQRQARGPGPFGNMFGGRPPFDGFQQPPQQQPPQPQQRSGTGTAPAPNGQAVDLVKCRQCGAYIAATGARSCGRDDCPQPK